MGLGIGSYESDRVLGLGVESLQVVWLEDGSGRDGHVSGV